MKGLWWIVVVAFLACGGDDGAGQADAAAPGIDASGCSYSGFTTESDMAERDDELEVLFYSAADDDRRLTVDFYFSEGATDGAQTVVLDGEGYDTCSVCVIARTDCLDLTCGKSFMPQSGTLEITAMGAAGEPLTGSITSALFAEVEIDPNSLATTLVPGGETWCLDDYSFDTVVTAP